MLDCWTYTPQPDYQVRDRGDGRYEPLFQGENVLGSYHTAALAMGDLCTFYGLSDDSEHWEYTPIRV